MSHAIVVDDNMPFLKFVTLCLAQEGYRVTPLNEAKLLLETLKNQDATVVLLDRFLPGYDGFDLCRQVKAECPDLPVIMFSTAGEVGDVIQGLNIGADDYLPKPFSPEMLIAKINAVCRRYQQVQQDLPQNLHVGPLEIRRAARTVLLEGKPLNLTKSEYRILEALASKPSVVLEKEEILHKAFDYPEDCDYLTSNLAFHMTALRKKLGHHRHLIQTIRGFGYCLSPPENP